jgi:hypothetical protein
MANTRAAEVGCAAEKQAVDRNGDRTLRLRQQSRVRAGKRRLSFLQLCDERAEPQIQTPPKPDTSHNDTSTRPAT